MPRHTLDADAAYAARLIFFRHCTEVMPPWRDAGALRCYALCYVDGVTMRSGGDMRVAYDVADVCYVCRRRCRRSGY